MVKAPMDTGEAVAFRALNVSDAANADATRGGVQKNLGARSSVPRRLALIQVIEAEIIPRLLLTHRSDTGFRPALSHCPKALRWTEDPATLAAWFLRTSEEEILSSLQLISESAEGREDVYYRILAAIPSALETLWERGECSLEAMTHGLALLDHVLEELHRCERGNGAESCLTS